MAITGLGQLVLVQLVPNSNPSAKSHVRKPDTLCSACDVRDVARQPPGARLVDHMARAFEIVELCSDDKGASALQQARVPFIRLIGINSAHVM